MKKLTLTFLILLIAMQYLSAQVVDAVAGLKFGTPQNYAINYLVDHFGDKYVKDGNQIYFGSVTIGNIWYYRAIFYFRKDKFVAAEMYSIYDLEEASSAMSKRDKIVNVYKQKYSVYDSRFDDGDLCYDFGRSKYGDGYYPIVVSAYESYSLDKKSERYYYVNTSYYMYLIEGNLDDN